MAKDVIGELNELIKLDLYAISAYDQAIEACDNRAVKDKLTEFKGDHERHVTDLGTHVKALGGTPAERGGIAGKLLEGFTAIMSHGDHSALLAMRGNEEPTNRKYKGALEEELPSEARATVEKNYHDEQRHLAWIKEALDKRVWEEQRKVA